jgi:hypothetical protein
MGFGELTSVLPPDWEAKRVAIAKKHNLLVCALLAGALGLVLVVALLPSRHRRPIPPSRLIAAFLVAGATEAYGIYRIFQYDKEMCRQLGFLCPHCHQPLYEPRSMINLNGKCPKCLKSILLS